MTDPLVLAEIVVGDDETLVRVPAKLMEHLAKDGLHGTVGNYVPPIVHVLDDGQYIVRGQRMQDPEALGQMHIPDDETCVEVTRSAMAALLVGG